jgi:archaellum component FlaC
MNRQEQAAMQKEIDTLREQVIELAELVRQHGNLLNAMREKPPPKAASLGR